MKRVLAGVLALVMLLCCMPAMAHAAGTDDQVKRYTVLVLDTSSSSTFIGSGGVECPSKNGVSFNKVGDVFLIYDF